MHLFFIKPLPFGSERVNQLKCCYCGVSQNLSRDHVIPTSYLRERRSFDGDWLVPACRECNDTIGSELLFNVPHRALWVLAAYRKKYRKLLQFPVWEDYELDEVSQHMRDGIVASMAAKERARHRLSHLQEVSMMPLNYLTSLRPWIEDEDVDGFTDEKELECLSDILRRSARKRGLTDDDINRIKNTLSGMSEANRRAA